MHYFFNYKNHALSNSLSSIMIHPLDTHLSKLCRPISCELQISWYVLKKVEIIYVSETRSHPSRHHFSIYLPTKILCSIDRHLPSPLFISLSHSFLCYSLYAQINISIFVYAGTLSTCLSTLFLEFPIGML